MKQCIDIYEVPEHEDRVIELRIVFLGGWEVIEDFWDIGIILFLDLGGGYKSVYICKIQWAAQYSFNLFHVIDIYSRNISACIHKKKIY